jgi:hypothetical protein
MPIIFTNCALIYIAAPFCCVLKRKVNEITCQPRVLFCAWGQLFGLVCFLCEEESVARRQQTGCFTDDFSNLVIYYDSRGHSPSGFLFPLSLSAACPVAKAPAAGAQGKAEKEEFCPRTDLLGNKFPLNK